MVLFLFLLSALYSTAGGTDGDSSLTDHYPEIKILPLMSTTEFLFKRIDDTLNATCSIIGANADKFYLEWITPIDVQNRYENWNHKLLKTNSLNLYMDALEEIDAGNYTCMASLPSTNVTLQKHFFLKINNRKGHCGKNHFSCNSETCIHQRYVCDGRLDCADGEDESERNCGTSPCQGKLTCDGRCIPVSWCCQQFIDANCTATVRLACCSEIHKPYIDSDNGISSADQQRLNDIHFLQTTIYIVIVLSTS
ncbi:uncharacterized protein LOC120354721 [Nilaparvata lugens]|uniref:uncharacterized protein LOC120354721 n=1 Tax=Nilaparvata lugens TaxID=108931 RepID=UPI00193C885E|nr:uncharacterized protein LOC120354721 [Nilaparvata lugens]